ncbi:iris-like [Dermacentor variabilis]|uniref:iris-like n=1 Tax=Dermacentor variabilis TaxID=34621 RepID=UPI003F5AF81B
MLFLDLRVPLVKDDDEEEAFPSVGFDDSSFSEAVAMRRPSYQWTLGTRDDDATDSGEEYVPSSPPSHHHRRRSSRRKSTSPQASPATSRCGSRRSLSLVSRRSSMSSSMTSSTSVVSRLSRTPHGAAPASPVTDDDLSSEMDSTDEDAETKRLREPSFNMAPEMSGCLLQFAVDVSRKLREGGDTRNLLVSPLLLAGMLVMLLHGCASRTSASAAALGRALHVHWAPFRMARSYDRVARATLAPFRRPKLRVQHFTYTCFMALFHDDSVPLAHSYYQMQERLSYLLVRRNFAQDAEQCRLSMDALARALSSFAFKPGHDIFPPGSVDERSLVVLFSCIRLEGAWRHSFQLVSGDFHETPEAAVTVAMMRQTGSFRMCQCSELEVTALELPYENRDVSLVVLLPRRLDGLAALEKRLTAARLLHCVARLEERHNVTVYMPRLKLRSVTDLGPVLKDMGLGVLFTDEANLRYLSKAEGAHLSGARHVAVLHANRKGARGSDSASSSSPSVGRGVVSPPSVGASPPTSPPSGTLSPAPAADSSSALSSGSTFDEPRTLTQFVVDRPFMLLMLKRRPDVVLLLGSVKKLV